MAEGVPSVLSKDTSGVAAAAAMAATVDRVVMALGTDLSAAREGMDANSVTGLTLSKGQSALVDAVTAAAKAPVVIVLLTATPLDISALLANPKVGAVLHVGQPSVAVRGVGRVLYGKTPPAGRMVQTVYPSAYATAVSIFDFNMRPGPSPWPAPGCVKRPATECRNGTNPGRTYRFYTGTPVVPFGYGLSYTSFKYVLASAPQAVVSLDPLRKLLASQRGASLVSLRALAATEPLVRYAVNVTNTGSVASDDVVLGFITPPDAGEDGAPLKSLFGFERVHVSPGQTVLVWLYPSLTDFAKVNADARITPLAGAYRITFGVAESAHLDMGYTEHGIIVK